MKAMVLTANNRLAAEDVGNPVPGDGQTLIRVTHSGVCGTDLKIYQGGIAVRHPLIMGHEMIGEVVEGGNGGEIKAGARVIIDPAGFCGTCFHCAIGQTHICPDGLLMGRDMDGGFAEYLAAPTDAVFALPGNVGGREAVLIQVLTTCVHAQRLALVAAGESVVVIGLGVAGLLQLQLAKAAGASPVIGITRSPWRRELAGQLGADVTLAPGEDTAARVRELTEGRGADLVIESVGKLSVLAEAIGLARTGGRLLLFGIYTETEAALPAYALYFKELNLINARAAKREDYPAAIALVQSGAVRLGPMVTHVLPLDDLERAITMLAERDDQRMKVLLDHT